VELYQKRELSSSASSSKLPIGPACSFHPFILSLTLVGLYQWLAVVSVESQKVNILDFASYMVSMATTQG
jgi:hypothetical protein